MKNDKNILLINGSIRGGSGNSGLIARHAQLYLKEKHAVISQTITLSQPKSTIREVYDLMNNADGFLIITGTYWNNWGSPLQRFTEVISGFENSPALFGKPVGCAVSMDSVGGAEVAAHIHFVFSGLGCWSPPCSSLVLSRIGQEALTSTQGHENDPNEDVWRLSDLDIVLDNLVVATDVKNTRWRSWPHIALKIPEGKWPETGELDLGTPIFL